MLSNYKIEDRLKLSEKERVLLIALLKGRMNKYFLGQQLMLDNSEGSRISNGTLYPALKRLKVMGIVVEHADGIEKATSGPDIEVTAMGREVLSWELMRLQDQINLAKERYRK